MPRTHADRMRDARRRKDNAMMIKKTGSGFNSDWDPTNDQFAKDRIALFERWGKEDPQKLVNYYNEKRNEVLDFHKAGKNLSEYSIIDGEYYHFLESRDGKQSGVAKAYNSGGRQKAEAVKADQVMRMRERALLGLATKSDLAELYRYDNRVPDDNSIKAQVDRAFNDLFDNDFFDGFRFGFGSVLQLGAPIFDLVPGAEGVSEYVDEAGKFVQGDIDSVDTIINRQQARDSNKPQNLIGQIISKVGEVFDPVTAIADDEIKAGEAREKERYDLENQQRAEMISNNALQDNDPNLGATAEDVDVDHEPQAPETEEAAQPVLPEGEEFKQAPVIENNGWQPGSFNSAGESAGNDIAGINTKLDKLQGDVTQLTSIVQRARDRKQKFQSGKGFLPVKPKPPVDDLARFRAANSYLDKVKRGVVTGPRILGRGGGNGNEGEREDVPYERPNTRNSRSEITVIGDHLSQLRSRLETLPESPEMYSEPWRERMRTLGTIRRWEHRLNLISYGHENHQGGGGVDPNDRPGNWRYRGVPNEAPTGTHWDDQIVSLRNEIAQLQEAIATKRGLGQFTGLLEHDLWHRSRLLEQRLQQAGHSGTRSTGGSAFTDKVTLAARQHEAEASIDPRKRITVRGGGLPPKRKREGPQGGVNNRPVNPALKRRLEELVDRLQQLAFDDEADPEEEQEVEDEILAIEAEMRRTGQQEGRVIDPNFGQWNGQGLRARGLSASVHRGQWRKT